LFSLHAALLAARLVIVDPGHFHAALIQKDMYPSISPRVSVYGPLSPELIDYLNRISLFNTRKENPTRWELEVHTGPDFFERMLREKAGEVVVFTGRNREKIGRIVRSLESGLHVFADKPWIIRSADLPQLETALNMAERKGLAAYDIMTERFEVTSVLQRELVNTPEVFGTQVTGSAAEPGIKARSIHHIMKLVAGLPIRRPVWFFDIDQYGEALADVGTHVVDLVQWTAFPERPLDYRNEIQVLDARHWPTAVTKAHYRQVTGEAEFPPEFARWVKNGQLDYYSNNFVHYTARGIHVALDILWNWEAPEGSGDVYEASFRGSRARIEVRQGKAEKFAPELYVVPGRPEAAAALKQKIATLQATFPGLSLREQGSEFRLVIPERFRVGHEAHFAQVANRFFEFMKAPRTMPAREKADMLAKYYVSTRGVEMAQGK
jgi:predicted dehydrogenase